MHWSHLVERPTNSEYVDDFLKVFSDLPSFTGRLNHLLIKTGDKKILEVDLWESEDTVIEATEHELAEQSRLRNTVDLREDIKATAERQLPWFKGE